MSQDLSIVARARAVSSKADFVEFLRALKADLVANPGDWENPTLGGYLAGMAEFARDIEGYYANRRESVDLEAPSWRVMAEILVAARVYQ